MAYSGLPFMLFQSKTSTEGESLGTLPLVTAFFSECLCKLIRFYFLRAHRVIL